MLLVNTFMNKLNNKYFFLFILILFITLVFIVGYNHEPWADEAQCWLICRDNSLINILKETKYEGHPFIWFFIEKAFIKVGSKLF